MLRNNNAEALVLLNKISKEELEQKFGCREALDGAIVGALPNADTEGMKYTLLHTNPAGVVAGLKILSVLTGASKAILSVSCDVNEQELMANAGIANLDLTIVKEKLVNVRAHENDLLVKIDELVNMAEILMGREPMALVMVEDEIREVAPKTKILSLISGDMTKGILADHKFYTLDQAEDLVAGDLVSGVIKTIKTTDCAVDQTGKEIRVLREKSCGKCTFCREGLYQLEQSVEEIKEGRGKNGDKEFMAEISELMLESCNCSLGDAAGLPVQTMLQAYEAEVDAHIRRKECPAGVCLALTNFYIDPTLCQGCGKCAEVCEAGAIDVRKGYVSELDSFDCTRCGACLEACPVSAIKKVSGKLPKLPSKRSKLKGVAVEEAEKTVKTAVKRKKVYGSAVTVKKPEQQAVETKKTEKVQVNIVKTINTELVIVAGGPAGLAAAIAAGEKGIKSIILEKSSTTGGAANMGMGPLGIDTKIQRALFNNITVEEALKLHMEYTHYAVDEDLVQAYFNRSADTIEWLEDMGVEFAGAFRYFKESAATWHIVKPENGVIGPRAASAMIKKMTERAKELGCEILLGTPATSLIQENGKVCGAIAVDSEGNGIEVRGKAVLVATGGFGNNKEMIKEHFNLTLGEDFFPFMIPGITGDGLKMMWEVGAAKFGANIEAIYQLPDNLNWFLLDAVLRQPNLLINQNGERFMNEGMMGNTTFTGNALRLQPGNYGYCIMDEGILKEYKKNGPDIVDIVHPADAFIAFDGQAKVAVEQNYPAYIEAETIPELAEKLGIDADKLQETIDEYNEMCESGVDTKFYKDHRYLHPITGKGKYLVGKYYLAAYGTVGGVRINKYGEVMNEQNMPIEGLYSAGSDANTIYGDSYNFTLCGNTMGFAVNTGRMAGEAAADYIADLAE